MKLIQINFTATEPTHRKRAKQAPRERRARGPGGENRLTPGVPTELLNEESTSSKTSLDTIQNRAR